MTSQRRPTRIFLMQAMVVLVVMWAAGSYVGNRFRLGIDDQQKHCLPYKYYLIDQGDMSVPTGGYVAFWLDDRGAPYFQSGTKFIKQVRAASGDHVEVKGGQVSLNGKPVATLDPNVLDTVNKTSSDYDKDFVLGENDLWVMGTSDDSYDSRYWGPISKNQVAGQVYPIF